MESISIPTEQELAVLPKNIRQILPKTPAIEAASVNSQDLQSFNKVEQQFITALQKAEQLVEGKIAQLRKKPTIRKTEVMKFQYEIKEEVVKELPQVTKENSWDTWTPPVINDKLLTQGIYCVKCQKILLVLDMQYEISKEESYYEVQTIHITDSEEHKNTTRITTDTFEILSKPILTVEEHKNAKKVEA